MRLSRMGSMHPTRLSFMRVLLRRAENDGWRYDRPVWNIDADGVGHAVYRVRTPDRSYSLVAFAHDLPDELRSDRVIAEAWDSTFALFDGEPTEADIARLRDNVPRQEAGRVSGSELTLSRANRSVRLFGHVVDSLAAGHQPDPAQIERVGYLMRTTAVYGSAKFGLSDREAVADRAELSPPFQAEMLTVWLIRAFTVDVVEHLARARSDKAVDLDPAMRRRLGVGNSTGLGMAPFLINHPVLIHHWFQAREEALARVRSAPLDADKWTRFLTAFRRARETVASWLTEHPYQVQKLAALDEDLTRLGDRLARTEVSARDWDTLWTWGEEELSMEGQELLLSLVLEPYGELVDDLVHDLAADEAAAFALDGRQTVGALLDSIRRNYGWALRIDWALPDNQARIWYTSEEKLEPRLGERFEEPLEPYEQTLGPARDIAALTDVLAAWPLDTKVAEVLLAAPEHRHTVRRVQMVARHPFGEVRDNTLGAEMMPIDLLRAKLSFFGATCFDPRSDRWVRITMFQGAPFPQELGRVPMDEWMYGA
ncbi:MAG: hypothetical protein AAGH68_14085 [Pseudomonadota bacterium]